MPLELVFVTLVFENPIYYQRVWQAREAEMFCTWQEEAW